jgi:hypothetical protein
MSESQLQLVSIVAVSTLAQKVPGDMFDYPVPGSGDDTYAKDTFEVLESRPDDLGIRIGSKTSLIEFVIPFAMCPYIVV